jgi:antitoxin StbD
VAILNRNTPAAYLVPAAAWEALLERLDDLELAAIVRERANEVGIPVNIDKL